MKLLRRVSLIRDPWLRCEWLGAAARCIGAPTERPAAAERAEFWICVAGAMAGLRRGGRQGCAVIDPHASNTAPVKTPVKPEAHPT